MNIRERIREETSLNSRQLGAVCELVAEWLRQAADDFADDEYRALLRALADEIDPPKP